ncbi:hypothetical protein B0T11DRAFT_280873 [Plectosphaerella cucumerina]|uniref:Infection structure specific protein n=1 Tax=Plectosphaerella cucumerina TaxID=40658 RepID=A0A8K0TFI2_9PEZI|nr:hypothetical protein B0T11DRAFT_280873 [Plectosphaerella cucumerina]
MHPSTSLVLAALAASATASQVNVVHVLEKLEVIPRSSPNTPSDAILARQDASDEECNSSLSSIIADMPTLPSEFMDYAMTATEPMPTGDSCTLALPLSLSKPLLDSVTAFARWGADKSQDAVQYMENCDAQGLNDPDSPPIMNPGDLITQECSEEPVLLFTDASTTATVSVSDVIDDLRDEILASLSTASTGAVETVTKTSPASGSATPSSSGSDSEDASSTGADESAASGAAQSTGAGDGSGAARFGLTAAGVAAMAGVAGLFVSL